MSELLKEFEECAREIIMDDLGVKVVLISPDGKKQAKSALDPEEDLKCSVFRETLQHDVRTGQEHVVENPVAVFALASLDRVPKAGEDWLIRIPKSIFDEELESWMISGPPESSKTVGYINLKLREVSQI